LQRGTSLDVTGRDERELHGAQVLAAQLPALGLDVDPAVLVGAVDDVIGGAVDGHISGSELLELDAVGVGRRCQHGCRNDSSEGDEA
jgi:hypothetical protein